MKRVKRLVIRGQQRHKIDAVLLVQVLLAMADDSTTSEATTDVDAHASAVQDREAAS